MVKPLRLEFTGRIGESLKAFGLGPGELNRVENRVHPLVAVLYNLPEALLSEFH